MPEPSHSSLRRGSNPATWLQSTHRTDQPSLCQAQQFYRRIEAGDRAQCGAWRSRLGLQAQHRSSDDAERAFAADEQLLEVVAGVVLLHLVEHQEHRAIGKHHFEAENVLTGHAVADHPVAAGVGRFKPPPATALPRPSPARTESPDRGRPPGRPGSACRPAPVSGGSNGPPPRRRSCVRG